MLKTEEEEKKKEQQDKADRVLNEGMMYKKYNDPEAWVKGLKCIKLDKRAHYARDPPNKLT